MEKQKYFNVMKNYKRMCSNLIANICAYGNWSDEFSWIQFKSIKRCDH